MIILPTYSPCLRQGDDCIVDRKLHTGLCEIAGAVGEDIVVIAPELTSSHRLMDALAIAADQLPYEIASVQCDARYRLAADERARVEGLVKRASFIYGVGFGVPRMARRHGKPYIALAEFDLSTHIAFACDGVNWRMRRWLRSLRAFFRFVGEARDRFGAIAVHCNGYPAMVESRWFHANRLLYLDSRMSEEMVIDEAALEERLKSLMLGRRPRLIYSGRFESTKGALDVIEVGVGLAARGVDFELSLYGRGSQAEQMRARVRAAGLEARIEVQEPVPFPDLVLKSHASDLFLCCHSQGDPSCTYLEASGAGLPIVGYGNRMWRSFLNSAGNGVVCPVGKPDMMVEAIIDILSGHERLVSYARNSREFAIQHSFEREFAKRTAALRASASSAT